MRPIVFVVCLAFLACAPFDPQSAPDAEALTSWMSGSFSRDLRGDSCATSQVTVRPGRIESCDRRFDAYGVQVRGAEKGGYVFLGK
jgi:hypothetical protein